MAKKVLLTNKERDAIDSMIELWYDSGNPSFNTQRHGKFKEKDMEKLIYKMAHRDHWEKFKKVI